MGHGRVQTTERYYVPCTRSRGDRLVQFARDAHERDPLLEEPYSNPDRN